MGPFFLKNWYLYGLTFKFHGGKSLPKPILTLSPEYPVNYFFQIFGQNIKNCPPSKLVLLLLWW